MSRLPITAATSVAAYLHVSYALSMLKTFSAPLVNEDGELALVEQSFLEHQLVLPVYNCGSLNITFFDVFTSERQTLEPGEITLMTAETSSAFMMEPGPTLAYLDPHDVFYVRGIQEYDQTGPLEEPAHPDTIHLATEISNHGIA